MPPTIDGYVLPILQQNTGSSASRAKSPTPSALPLPTLTPQDKTKYMKIFLSCNPVNGMLSGKSDPYMPCSRCTQVVVGDKASEVFVKSKLPVDKLSQIWFVDLHALLPCLSLKCSLQESRGYAETWLFGFCRLQHCHVSYSSLHVRPTLFCTYQPPSWVVRDGL
jgi:hypothetical protein